MPPLSPPRALVGEVPTVATLVGRWFDSITPSPTSSVAGTAAAVVADAAVGTAGGSGGGCCLLEDAGLSFLFFSSISLRFALRKQGTIYQHMVASNLSRNRARVKHSPSRGPYDSHPSRAAPRSRPARIRDPLLIIALAQCQAVAPPHGAGHPPEEDRRMGESRWMSLHKVSTSVPPPRPRIGLNILQSLHRIVESSHHLHPKPKRPICRRRRRVRGGLPLARFPVFTISLAAVETIS
ncbi:hypothetical protein U9M48_034497, partial [Paspalum notatum var. saurae]